MRAIIFIGILLSIIMAISISYAQTTMRISASVTILESKISTPVGGMTSTINKLEILTPYIALAGLIAVVSVVYVIKRRKD